MNPENVRPLSTLTDNIGAVQTRLAVAAQKCGRDPETIRLVAVSKTQPAEVVAAASAAGLHCFGENRIEEAMPKMADLAGQGIEWHMIGHIQSRKARAVVAARFQLVHSVDSLKLAERMNQAALDFGRRQDILLECNVSGESRKSGFGAQSDLDRQVLLPVFDRIQALPGLHVCGLMTIAPLNRDPWAAQPFFMRLRSLRDFFAARFAPETWQELSMGMSDDHEAAVAEGATLVRIGRAIFGERG